MTRLLERFGPAWAAAGEGGAGGAGEGGADGGGAGDPGQGAGKGGGSKGEGGKGGSGAGAPPAPYYPAGLPDQFRASDERGTIDALFQAFNGAQQQLGAIPKAPEKPDGYTLTLDEKVAAKVGDLGQDPLMKSVRQAAHEAGLGGEQFQGFMSKVLGKMVEMGAYAPAPNDDTLAGQLLDPALAGQAREDALGGARERLTNARAWVDGLDPQKFGDEERAELLLMTQTPGGVKLVERMMAGTVNNPVALGGQQQQGRSIREVIEGRLQDPRNRPGSPTYDQAFAKETRRMQIKHI